MDEVTVERLIQKYKDNGELDDEDPALLMLKQWPASKQYIDIILKNFQALNRRYM